jgi:hypothetical protein
VVILAVWAVVGTIACDRKPPEPAQGPTPNSAGEEQTLNDFKKRVEDYGAIHRRIEGELPKLSTEATPEQIDANQRAFGARMAEARPGARQGDIFTPEMQKLVRDHLARIFSAKDGNELKASIMDENPIDVKIAVDGRYPDDVPVATMPPEILQMLPKMPDELEYRFVGRHLVILDPHAHIIADYVPNAIP